MIQHLRIRLVLLLTLLAATLQPAAAPHHRAWVQTIRELSEPQGYFDSDNLISNESSYLTVLNKLADMNVRGGAYLGVGPDQNFTYITRVRPEVAIIIDIRRQNMIQHLLLKSLMEMADTRLDYLSLLLGRPTGRASRKQEAALNIEELVEKLDAVEPDDEFYRRTVARVKRNVIENYGFHTTTEDLQGLEYIHENFFRNGLDIRYRSFGRMYQLRYPSYRDLLLEKDIYGNYGNYLNSEADYQWLRNFQKQNRLIPIVGDLAGPKAVRAVGDYLRSRSLAVSAFYVSNVEFYLLRYDTFDAFVRNVGTLPTTPVSVIIRSYFGYGNKHPEQLPQYRMATLLQQIDSFVGQHQADPYKNYWDLVNRDFVPLVSDALRTSPLLYAPP